MNRRSGGRAIVFAARSTAWLVLAGLLAFGSAGIVAGIDHPPGAARPELTWAADEAIAPGLDGAVADLARLSGDVDAVGSMGRKALASLTSQDVAGLSASIADGSTLIDQVDREVVALRTKLEKLPGAGPGIERRVGATTLDRYDRIVAALASTSALSGDWSTLAGGADTASQLTSFLVNHDRLAAEAARAGSTGDYNAALQQLGKAQAALDAATKLRNTLANAADVSTLDQWLTRNGALDKALHDLYTALLSSHGQATPAVRAAVDAEKKAQANLPPDTRAMVVIMSDVARGGLNQAVIEIEQARGRLADAVAGLGGAGSVNSTPPP